MNTELNEKIIIRASMRWWAKRWRVTKGKARRIALRNAVAERRQANQKAVPAPTETAIQTVILPAPFLCHKPERIASQNRQEVAHV